MRRLNNNFFFSATDLNNHLNCNHLTTLNREAAEGKKKRPNYTNRTTEVLRQKGEEFEASYLEILRQQGLSIIQIEKDDSNAFLNTIAAMEAGADIIYQGRLEEGQWQGWADFMIKVNKPTSRWTWSYEITDTKLANNTKASTLVQIALYSHMLSGMQGMMPENMHVMKPDGTESYRVNDYLGYVLHAKKKFLGAFNARIDTYPDPVGHCDLCNWWEHCNKKRREDDHLGFIAGMGARQTNEVRQHQINTLEAMASLPIPIPFTPAKGVAETYEKLREQARLQHQSRMQQRPVHERLPLDEEEKQGFFKLPEPSHADIYLDLEGDPLVEPSGREYMFGWYHLGQYNVIWAESADEEKAAFETFMDVAAQIKSDNPDMHIYHFGAYEQSAFKRLMCKYATRENEMDTFLRSSTFIDLHRVVKHSIRAGVERYSLKDLEKYHGYIRQMDLRILSGFKAEYEVLLETGRQAEATADARNAIVKYNEDDCISTHSLHVWLERERQLWIDDGFDIPRPPANPGAPSDKITAHQQRIKPLFDALMVGIPPEENDRTDEEQAHFILANMLDWYRREEKSFWWEYFRIIELPDDELYDEKAVLIDLVFTGEQSQDKKSFVYTYRFTPQEFEIRKGHLLSDRNMKSIGNVVDIDRGRCLIKIKKGPSLMDQHHTEVFLFEKFSAMDKENSIIGLASWVLDFGINNPSKEYSAARDLLLARNPRTTSPVVETQDHIEKAIDWSLKLDHSILPIQGPPGTGKSFTAGKMIIGLIKNGKKIGVTALSHKVIASLLHTIWEMAEKEGIKLKMIQKVSDRSGTTMWEEATDSNKINNAIATHDVIAGTPFMWAATGWMNELDYLFVDEAGQLSLIDTLSIAQVAKNLILLGDPQQLKQPQQGVHPDGTEVSTLEHILKQSQTITDLQGIFLGLTRRMHPAICSFDSDMFYEGKLFAMSGLEKQAISGNTRFDGSGLRYISVDHTGNTSSSTEEVEVVVGIIQELTKGDVYWTDENDIVHPLTLRDIKVISPYNAQVNAIADSIPGLLVGTVDKFQGQEAAVVIYSMATSTPEDAPRGMDFLYSPNRLNVAVSRARAMFIMVANPAIFSPECKSPKQIMLANPFCEFLERMEL
jgi:uncharacterized protein